MSKPAINVWAGNPQRHNLSRRTSKPKFVTIHYTAGTGSAKNNCSYFSGGNRNASADFFIDKDGSIWQFNPSLEHYYTWAVGDGRGRYGITNSNSIAIEVVNTGGAFTEAQISSLQKLVTWLMSTYGIPAANVVRHYDASRKQCPLYYVDPSRWAALRKRITSTAAQATPSGKMAVDGVWGETTTRRSQQLAGTTVDGIVSNQPAQYRKNVACALTGVWMWRQSGYAGGSALIKAIQGKLGVVSDGFCGPTTVSAMQTWLKKAGYYSGNVDKSFGPASCRAYQQMLNAGRFFR